MLAELVRKGARLADVGTDHAYLPAYLLKTGRIPFAVASDIAEGPLQKAVQHLSGLNQPGKWVAVQTPGLTGIENYLPEDIVIAGMGGEMILSILDSAPFVKDPRIHLILQPMTKPELLRRYLAENGFEILEERIAREGTAGEGDLLQKERFYQAILCRFSGVPYKLSRAEELFGPLLLEKKEENTRWMLEKKKIQWQKVIAGKEKGGLSGEEERAVLDEIEEKLKGWRTV